LKDVITLAIFKHFKSENSVLCSVFKKRGGDAYMISVAEQSAIKIVGIKQDDMSGEWSKYTQHIILGSILSS